MSEQAQQMTPETAQFVEEIGLVMEESRHPRIAGRIVGWLLVCEPAHQSFNDLVEVLGASKGSISNMTRRLLQAGLIERFAVPGERQTYFRIRPGAWVRVLRAQIEVVRHLLQVADRGLEMMKEGEGDRDLWRLQEMRDFYQFISRKIPGTIEEYEQEVAPQTEGRRLEEAAEE